MKRECSIFVAVPPVDGLASHKYYRKPIERRRKWYRNRMDEHPVGYYSFKNFRRILVRQSKGFFDWLHSVMSQFVELASSVELGFPRAREDLCSKIRKTAQVTS